MATNNATLAFFTPKDCIWPNPQSAQARIDKIGSADVLRFKNGTPGWSAYFDGVLPRGANAGYTATTGVKVTIGWTCGAESPVTTGAAVWAASFQLDGQTDLPSPWVDNFPATGSTNEKSTTTNVNSTTAGGMNYTTINVPLASIQNGQTTAPAAGDHYRLRVRRATESASDTIAQTCYVLSVELQDY